MNAARWPLHNFDLAGSRFSALDHINTSNVASLAPRRLFQHGVIDGASNQTTPVVVDGVMYVTDPRGSVYALDAADGHLLWTYDVTSLLDGGTGELLWKFNTGAGVFSSSSVYMVNGEEFVTVGSGRGERGRRGGDLILSFALLTVTLRMSVLSCCGRNRICFSVQERPDGSMACVRLKPDTTENTHQSNTHQAS